MISFSFRSLFCFLFLALSSQAIAEPLAVGYREIAMPVPGTTKPVRVHSWYPTKDTKPIEQLGSGPVFQSLAVVRNGELPKTVAPLVILSHGSGGLAIRLTWLAGSLAKAGAIVVAPDHPGNSFGDNSPRGLLEVWKRAELLREVTDHLLSNSDFRGSIDSKRIFAVGHSAGGGAVLLLVGARLDSNKFASPVKDCTSQDKIWVRFCEEAKNVPVSTYPRRVVERSYADSRIKKVVALDPGFGRSINHASLKEAGEKILVIGASVHPDGTDNLGVPSLKKLLPKGHFEVVKGADHMAFLTPCKSDDLAKDPDLSEVCRNSSQRPFLQEITVSLIKKFFAGVIAATLQTDPPKELQKWLDQEKKRDSK